jgi:hypothetical protein
MPRPRVVVQRSELRDEFRPQGVEVYIAHQFEKVEILLAEDGLVAVLE